MNLPEWILPILTFLTGSTLTILGILYVFITNPDKIVKWGSIVFKVLSYRSKRAEKIYMATDIQSTIDEERKKMGAQGEVLSYGIQIKWTDEEKAEVDLKDSKVLIMMRPFKSQSRNLANAVSLYVPRALLPKSRRYIYPNIVTGLDYTISKAFLKNNHLALEYFQEREIEKHDELVVKILNLIEPIHIKGRLTRIYISELKKLSTLYPHEPSRKIYEETINLLKEIHSFETSEHGEKLKAKGIFQGDFFKMCIVPVGKGITLTISGVEKHLDFIGDQLKNGIQNFYVVSAGSISDAKNLVKLACMQYELSVIFEDEYKGIFRGKRTKMYCSLCVALADE